MPWGSSAPHAFSLHPSPHTLLPWSCHQDSCTPSVLAPCLLCSGLPVSAQTIALGFRDMASAVEHSGTRIQVSRHECPAPMCATAACLLPGPVGHRGDPHGSQCHSPETASDLSTLRSPSAILAAIPQTLILRLYTPVLLFTSVLCVGPTCSGPPGETCPSNISILKATVQATRCSCGYLPGVTCPEPKIKALFRRHGEFL